MKTTKRNIIIFEILMWVVCLLFISPMIPVIINSIKPFNEVLMDPIAIPKDFTIANYIEVWKITKYPKVLFNTVLVTGATVSLIILMGSMAGYILSRTKSKMSNFILAFFSISMMVPFQMLMIPLVRVGQIFKLQNSVLGLVPIYVGISCSLAVLLYHGFTKTIPKEMEESAYMDGCSGLNMFFRIIFPLLKPTSVTIAVLYVLTTWNDVTLPMVLLSDKNNTTLAMSQLIFYRQLVASRWDLLLASGIMASIPVIIFYIFMQRYILEGVVQGAVKG